MKRIAALCFATFFARPGETAEVRKGVAILNSYDNDRPVTGILHFEEKATEPGVMYVSGRMSGFVPNSKHGFHVHQFGDAHNATQASSSQLGKHFIPKCTNRRSLQNVPGSDLDPSDCAKDQIHGMPPAEVRQSGDMGNIQADENGVVVILADSGLVTSSPFRQNKMSLTDVTKSVLGRSVVVHTLEDDGTTEGDRFGNAGPALAWGIIGLENPGLDTNAAVSPQVPRTTEISCTFGIGQQIMGEALITRPMGTNKARLQARLWHPENMGGAKSFHFHTYGDLTNTPATVGEIYESSVNIDTLQISASDYTEFDAEFDLRSLTSSVADYVGRSLTIHDGPTTDSDTIAYSVCGNAHPDSLKDFNINTAIQSQVTDVTDAGIVQAMAPFLLLVGWVLMM